MQKENKGIFSIAHDHFHVLMVAQMIQEDGGHTAGLPDTPEAKARYVIHFYNQELENHFYIEESVLLPEVTGISKEIDEILKDVDNEHKEIGKMVNSLNDEKDLSKKLNDLGKCLEAHVNKEERELFPKIQETLSEQELEELAAKLNANGYQYTYKA